MILITLDAFSYELFIDNLDSLPNLRTLKSQSVFFENAFSVGPSTHFAFPGIIASVYPYHLGVGIDKNVKTIEYMRKGFSQNARKVRLKESE